MRITLEIVSYGCGYPAIGGLVKEIRRCTDDGHGKSCGVSAWEHVATSEVNLRWGRRW